MFDRTRPVARADLAIAVALLGCGGAATGMDAGRYDASVHDAGPHDAGSHDADARVEHDAGATRVTRVYVGQRDGELAVYSLDPDSGELTRVGATRTGDFPSFAALAPDGRRMVVVNEAADEVASLSVASSGATTLVNAVSSVGGPTHVTVHPTLEVAYAANYGGHDVRAFPLTASGRVEPAIDVEPAGRNAHAVVVDRTGRWLLVPCKGDDWVASFEIDAAGMLTRRGEHRTAAGAGPRHLAFDGAGTHAYLVNELDSTVDVLAFDPASGSLSQLQTISTVPASHSGANTTAEILLSPDHRFVYASNRGHDSIAIFEILPDATLAARGHALLEARTPRSMTIDPSGTFLVAGALDSDVLVRFRRSADGGLARLGTTAAAGPWYVGAFALPAAP